VAVLNKDTSSPSTNYIFKQYLNKFSKRDEVTGEWRKLRKEELNYRYCLPNIVRGITSRRMRWAGNVARIGEKRDVYRVLVGKSEGKRLLGRARPRWEDNIKKDL